jgi:hypothetical protein
MRQSGQRSFLSRFAISERPLPPSHRRQGVVHLRYAWGLPIVSPIDAVGRGVGWRRVVFGVRESRPASYFGIIGCQPIQPKYRTGGGLCFCTTKIGFSLRSENGVYGE